jgi:hypothetical protein
MVESPAPARHEWWGMRRDWLDSGHAIRLEKDQPAKAQEFVRRHHRHHPPPRVHSFSLGLFLDNVLIAVLIAAPPIARALDDGRTIEVSCLCTLGHRNAASQLLGHFGRIARDFNYYSLTTYTLAAEEGASLRASGWHPVAVTNGRPWGSTSRLRKPARWPECRKRRWVRDLRERAPNQVALAHVQRRSSWPVGRTIGRV